MSSAPNDSKSSQPEAKMEELKLSSGYTMPILGLGTWKSKPGKVEQAVKYAISECGYRHIDCAAIYGNEVEVGNALKDCMENKGIKREELFITSKVWNLYHAKEEVLPACKKTLKDLGLTYLDLYLIHWPMGFTLIDGNYKLNKIHYTETWAAMEELVKSGLVRSIGISNFNIEQVDDIMKMAKIAPSINQIESNPYIAQTELISHCEKHGIKITAYSPLGSQDNPARQERWPVLLKDKAVVALAKKYGKTPAHICLRYHIERKVSVIPKSVTPSRIAANIDVFNFKLTAEDMKDLEKTEFFRSCCPPKEIEWKGEKIFIPRDLCHPYFPFEECLEKFKDIRAEYQDERGWAPEK